MKLLKGKEMGVHATARRSQPRGQRKAGRCQHQFAPGDIARGEVGRVRAPVTTRGPEPRGGLRESESQDADERSPSHPS